MPPPLKIDRYEILGQLGKGANGIVYLARDTRGGREVAMKIINPELARDPVVLRRFHREAKAISRLSHSNVLQLLDYSGPNAELPYLVTERLNGDNLDDLIAARQGPLDGPHAAAIAHEICLGLQHAHSLGIVHRDLKPENVFLEPDGRVVLCDFGIARSFDTAEQGTLASKNTRLAGSPLYMSPEQISTPQSVGPASDMFALGSLLYFLATGRHAFLADTVVNALKRIVKATPDSLREARPGLPERFYRIVDKLLARDPARRYTSAQAIADSLLLGGKEAGHADPRRGLTTLLQQLGGTGRRSKSRIIAVEDLDAESKTVVASAASGKVQRKRAEPKVDPKAPIAETAIAPAYRSSRAQTPARIPGRPSQVPLIIATILGLGLIIGGAMLLSARQRDAAQAKLPPAIVATGTLRVTTHPGSEIFVDDRKIGASAAIGPTPLPAGRHLLRVVHPKLGQAEQPVDIQEGVDLTVSVDLRRK